MNDPFGEEEEEINEDSQAPQETILNENVNENVNENTNLQEQELGELTHVYNFNSPKTPVIPLGEVKFFDNPFPKLMEADMVELSKHKFQPYMSGVLPTALKQDSFTTPSFTHLPHLANFASLPPQLPQVPNFSSNLPPVAKFVFGLSTNSIQTPKISPQLPPIESPSLEKETIHAVKTTRKRITQENTEIKSNQNKTKNKNEKKKEQIEKEDICIIKSEPEIPITVWERFKNFASNSNEIKEIRDQNYKIGLSKITCDLSAIQDTHSLLYYRGLMNKDLETKRDEIEQDMEKICTMLISVRMKANGLLLTLPMPIQEKNNKKQKNKIISCIFMASDKVKIIFPFCFIACLFCLVYSLIYFWVHHALPKF